MDPVGHQKVAVNFRLNAGLYNQHTGVRETDKSRQSKSCYWRYKAPIMVYWLLLKLLNLTNYKIV